MSDETSLATALQDEDGPYFSGNRFLIAVSIIMGCLCIFFGYSAVRVERQVNERIAEACNKGGRATIAGENFVCSLEVQDALGPR